MRVILFYNHNIHNFEGGNLYMDMLDTVREILSKQLRIDKSEIGEDTSIREDLGVDSLDVVEMLMSIEEECGVVVPDDEIANLKTVGDVARYIENNK